MLASKIAQRPLPRAQELPKSAQEAPKSAPREPRGRREGSKRCPESAKIAQKSAPSPVGNQLRSKSASGTIFGTIFDRICVRKCFAVRAPTSRRSRVESSFANYAESAFRIVKYSVRGLSAHKRVRASSACKATKTQQKVGSKRHSRGACRRSRFEHHFGTKIDNKSTTNRPLIDH